MGDVKVAGHCRVVKNQEKLLVQRATRTILSERTKHRKKFDTFSVDFSKNITTQISIFTTF
jgi:hypothetical protein